jgi:hypothetical protein
MRILVSVWSALALAVAVLVASPALALAAPPDTHDHFSGDILLSADDFCGFPVDDAYVVNSILHVNADGSFSATGSHSDIYTNPANGKSVVVSAAGPFNVGPRVVDEQAGTYSVTVSFEGLGIKFQTAAGGVLLRDVGLLSFTDTFLIATDEKIATTVVEHGQHPFADSGFALFCDVVTPALT